MVLLWAGYGVSSYGYVLVKGWNINVRQWFSPLNPYTWPKGSVPCYTGSGIFPSGNSSDNGPCGSAPSDISPYVSRELPSSGQCPPGFVRQVDSSGGGICVPKEYINAPTPPGGTTI